MRLIRKTQRWDRRSIQVGWGGVSAWVERPKVGGGWYIAQRIDVPWPFKKKDIDD